jgi:hypothetical protein
VTGADIADLSIGASDLDPATVGDVISASGTLPNTGANVDILAFGGFGVLKANCAAGGNLGFFYALNSPVQQKTRVFGRDPIDNSPIGSAPITGTAGGAGYGGGGHLLLEGDVWSFTDERVLTIEISIDPGCIYRVRATLDHNDAV